MKYLKQLLCRHVWIDDYITYKTIWPYTISWKKYGDVLNAVGLKNYDIIIPIEEDE